jgi:hypothetical protein
VIYSITHKIYNVKYEYELKIYKVYSWGGARLSPCQPLVGLPAHDDDECGAVDEMRIDRGNRSN